MATTFKNFLENDTVSTRTLLHENIPVTGTIVSSSVYLMTNVKTYSHGMYESVYDYPFLSSSANLLFDITAGQHSTSPGSSSNDLTWGKKKQNIYNQFAQVLVGFDATGSIQKFDQDGDISSTSATDKFLNAYFLTFSRLLVKDEIKKGSFSMVVGVNSSSAAPAGAVGTFNTTMTISDASGSTNYLVNSPVGEYGILYSGIPTSGSLATAANHKVGLIYYQAGIVVLSAGIFAISGTQVPSFSLSQSVQGQLSNTLGSLVMRGTGSSYDNISSLFQFGTIDDACASLRNRIKTLSFNNTTELNSTIHFCRINHNEFNYSSNPTYLSGSKIRVKNTSTDAPVSYFSTIGLYSADNELLGVAKLSTPIKKSPDGEMIIRIRNDY